MIEDQGKTIPPVESIGYPDKEVLTRGGGLSLSHLVPEILGPKVAVIIHQNVLFNRF